MAAETTKEFGDELRRDRELRDVSREQLAAATKVSVRQIESLESGRFELLPAEVFTRGFVRSIALHLGLDPEKSVAAFSHVHRGWAAAESQSRLSTESNSGTYARLSRPRRSVSSDTTVLGLGIAALLALITGTAAFVKSRSPEKGAPSPSPASSAAMERADSGPASLALPPAIAAATVALSPDPAPQRPVSRTLPIRSASPEPPAAAQRVESGREGVRLRLSFRADCWTEVSVNGRVVAAELFKKGTTREFAGAGRFTLTLGDAGAVDVAVDGRSLEAIGRPGEVVRNFPIAENLRSAEHG